MAAVIQNKKPTFNPIYQFNQIGNNVYQQVAKKKAKIEINDHFRIIRKGETGGFIYLSGNPEINSRQKHDIALANAGARPQNTWIDANSTLRGDFRLPMNSIIERSNINVENDFALILNNSYLKQARLQIKPNTSVSITKSDFIKSDLRTQPCDEREIVYINQSSISNTKLEPVHSCQTIEDSILNNIKLRGNSDIDASCLEMKEQQALLRNVSAHGTDIFLDKAILIASDCDIKEQTFTDKQAVKNYLVIKNDQLRAERLPHSVPTKSTNTKKPSQTELDL